MLPIYERFHTWQGEGTHMGRNAFFIRTYGCPVKCPWCDSAGTWHPDYTPKHVLKMDESDLVNEARAVNAGFIVVTGGEPTIYDLRNLCEHARRNHLAVHVETCGAFEIKGKVSWITLSPKWNALPLADNVKMAHELKLIISEPDEIKRWIDILTPLGARFGWQHTWLHPEWSKRDDPEVLCAISDAVKANQNSFRAGYQLHKLYRVDLLDNRSDKKRIPLGGNPDLGY